MEIALRYIKGGFRMNNCEKIGIVRLEDLPQNEIFVKLKSDLHKILEDKIRNIGIGVFEREIDLGRNIGHWLWEGRLIGLDVLFKVLSYFHLGYKDKIEFLRGNDGFGLKNHKLSFDFTF